MIRHVAMFSWIPEATAEQKQRVAAELAALAPLMRGLRGYLFGADAHLVEGNADFAVVADFEDAEAYLAYRHHPAHVEVVNRAIQPIARQRTTIQIEI